jgi:hypothetical protein
LGTKLETFHWAPSLEPSIGHQAWNLPLGTKLGTFHWPPNLEPSIHHQAWNIPLATKLWIYLHPLSLLFKRQIQIIGSLSFPGHNFQFYLEYICSHKFLEEEENDQPW